MLERSGLNTMMMMIQSYPSTLPKSIKGGNSSTTVKLFILPLLTVGTGGCMTIHNSIDSLERYYPRTHVEHPAVKNVDTRSPAEHVANIRDVLTINMSELASILGVTRPTAYAWLEGQEPKVEAVAHIQRLSHTADKIKMANIIQLDQLIRRPVLNGHSLLDIIKSNKDSSSILQILKLISEKEAQTRNNSKLFGENLRSLDDVSSEFSVAIYERS